MQDSIVCNDPYNSRYFTGTTNYKEKYSSALFKDLIYSNLKNQEPFAEDRMECMHFACLLFKAKSTKIIEFNFAITNFFYFLFI